MQKLVNFIIQTSQVDVAGYGSRFIFMAFQKSQRIAILGLFAKIMNKKKRLWGVDSIFFTAQKSQRSAFFKPFHGKIMNLIL
jgi:hypothetical protein